MVSWPDRAQLREHKCYADWDPDNVFTKPTAIVAKMDSLGFDPWVLGDGYIFWTVKRTQLDGKKVRIRWRANSSPYSKTASVKLWIRDGEYDRSSDTDFPSGSGVPSKGEGLLQTLLSKNTPFTWIEETVLVDIAGTEENVSLQVWLHDAWADTELWLEIDYLKILTADESETLYATSFTNPVVMERTGTTGDYGYVLAEMGSRNLSSSMVVRQPGSRNLSSSSIIRKSGSRNLSCSATIRHRNSENLSAGASIRNIGSGDLSASLITRHSDSRNLSCSCVLRKMGGSIDYSCFVRVSTGTSRENLPASCSIRKHVVHVDEERTVMGKAQETVGW